MENCQVAQVVRSGAAQRPFDAYIFDMDGTIVDNCAIHVQAWQQFSKKYGNQLTQQQILDWMGAQGAFYIEKIFGRKLPDADVRRLCAEKEAIYRQIYQPKLPEGLRAWLDYAHARNIPCALATGGPKENVDFILDALDLRKDFAVIVDATMYTQSKPAPDCFLTAARLMQVKPYRCRVFEDAVNGIGAARAAGMSVVAITFTNPRAVLEEAGADRVIDSYTELKIWPVRPALTAQDKDAIAYLDKLRTCADEPRPIVPPIAVVQVVAIENVPKANERYALVTVSAQGVAPWRVCTLRGTVAVGEKALFVTPNVVLPDEEPWPTLFHVKKRTYKYGFGVTERVLLLHLTRNIYHNNTGDLAPLRCFPQVKSTWGPGALMQALKVQPLDEFRVHVQKKPQEKKKAAPAQPMTVAERMHKARELLAKLRKNRKSTVAHAHTNKD